MSLKEFIECYDVFCRDDFDIIVKWASYNGCQSELISLISALASSMANDKKALEFQIHEWAAYAMELVPEIDIHTDFTTAINALRLAYFAYNGQQFVDFADKIMKVDCMSWSLVEDMHPMIWLKYKGVTENVQS
ncbi:MAG: hypothetical protein IJV94_03745 [Bacilli bacterium]|nr:hypothetical protein [Bacilli bacterium]